MTTTGRQQQQHRTDRLSIAAKRVLDPSTLVGSFFMTDHARGWQGCVVAEPSPGVYLVETFDWLVGASVAQALVSLGDMKDWTFYDDTEWMGNHYRERIERLWEHKREQEAEAKAES